MKRPAPLAQRIVLASRRSHCRPAFDAGDVAVEFQIPTRLLDPATLWHPGPGFIPQTRGRHAWLRDIPGLPTRAIVTHVGPKEMPGHDDRPWTDPELWDVTMPHTGEAADLTRYFIADKPHRITWLSEQSDAARITRQWLGTTDPRQDPAPTGRIDINRQPYAGSDAERSDLQVQQFERTYGIDVYTAIHEDRISLEPGSLWTCLTLHHPKRRELTDFARTAARLHHALGGKVSIYSYTGPGTRETTRLRDLTAYSSWQNVRDALDALT